MLRGFRTRYRAASGLLPCAVLLGSGLLQVALTADAVAVVLAVYLADNTKVFEFFLADIERTIEVEVIFARVSHSDLFSKGKPLLSVPRFATSFRLIISLGTAWGSEAWHHCQNPRDRGGSCLRSGLNDHDLRAPQRSRVAASRQPFNQPHFIDFMSRRLGRTYSTQTKHSQHWVVLPGFTGKHAHIETFKPTATRLACHRSTRLTRGFGRCRVTPPLESDKDREVKEPIREFNEAWAQEREPPGG